MSKTKIYTKWLKMLSRCSDSSRHNYNRYGGRGISVCKRWQTFESFYADVKDWGLDRPGVTLDRIDNDGDYCPENCRPASNLQQQNNRGDCVYLEHGGRRLTIAQWARSIGMSRSGLWGRLFKSGWSIERALTTPTKTTRKHKRKRYRAVR